MRSSERELDVAVRHLQWADYALPTWARLRWRSRRFIVDCSSVLHCITPLEIKRRRAYLFILVVVGHFSNQVSPDQLVFAYDLDGSVRGPEVFILCSYLPFFQGDVDREVFCPLNNEELFLCSRLSVPAWLLFYLCTALSLPRLSHLVVFPLLECFTLSLYLVSRSHYVRLSVSIINQHVSLSNPLCAWSHHLYSTRLSLSIITSDYSSLSFYLSHCACFSLEHRLHLLFSTYCRQLTVKQIGT